MRCYAKMNTWDFILLLSIHSFLKIPINQPLIGYFNIQNIHISFLEISNSIDFFFFFLLFLYASLEIIMHLKKKHF